MEKKSKIILTIAFLLSIGLVTAGYLVMTIPATVTVDEAFVISTTSVDVDVLPAETQCQTVSIENKANVDIDAQLVFVENSNEAGVSYSAPVVTETITALTTETPNFCVSVDSDSNVGVVSGNITISRL